MKFALYWWSRGHEGDEGESRVCVRHGAHTHTLIHIHIHIQGTRRVACAVLETETETELELRGWFFGLVLCFFFAQHSIDCTYAGAGGCRIGGLELVAWVGGSAGAGGILYTRFQLVYIMMAYAGSLYERERKKDGRKERFDFLFFFFFSFFLPSLFPRTKTR